MKVIIIGSRISFKFDVFKKVYIIVKSIPFICSAFALVSCGDSVPETPEEIFSAVIEVASNHTSDEDGSRSIYDGRPIIGIGRIPGLSGEMMVTAEGYMMITYHTPPAFGGDTITEFGSFKNYRLESDYWDSEKKPSFPATGNVIKADFEEKTGGRASVLTYIEFPDTFAVEISTNNYFYRTEVTLSEEKFLKVAELLKSDLPQFKGELAKYEEQKRLKAEQEEKEFLAREEAEKRRNEEKAKREEAERAALIAQKEAEEKRIREEKERELAEIARKKAEEAAKIKEEEEKQRQFALEIKTLKIDADSLPKAMRGRISSQRPSQGLRSSGGQGSTEATILRGLNWLKANQDPDGSWGSKDKDDQGNAKSSNKDAMTGMALLCFLAEGELSNSPKYGSAVGNAILFLTSTPPDKPLGGGNTGSYSHPIRTYALCEAYTMTKNESLREFAERAAIHVIKGQNENGGWAYGYGKGPAAHTDLSVTSWNIQALKAAILTGIPIDGLKESMNKAMEYVKKCQDSSGKFAYKQGMSGKASLTGAGAFSLQMGNGTPSSQAQKGLDWIVANQQQEWKEVDLYEWYYSSQACFHANGMPDGKKYWIGWSQKFQQIVCGAQASDGHWPAGAHFHGSTDIFRTTMATLMLQTPYRLRFALGEPFQVEAEKNDAAAKADKIQETGSPIAKSKTEKENQIKEIGSEGAWKKILECRESKSSTLDLSAYKLNNLESVKNLTQLTELRLTRKTYKMIDLAPLKGLSKLEVLDLGSFVPESLEQITVLPNLKEFSFLLRRGVNVLPLLKLKNIKKINIFGLGGRFRTRPLNGVEDEKGNNAYNYNTMGMIYDLSILHALRIRLPKCEISENINRDPHQVSFPEFSKKAIEEYKNLSDDEEAGKCWKDLISVLKQDNWDAIYREAKNILRHNLVPITSD